MTGSSARRLGPSMVCASIVLLGLQAGAGEPLRPADEHAIEACLAAKAKSAKAAECIGIVYQPCLNDTAGSTADESACLERERYVWDAWLNRDYARLLGRLEPNGKTILREVERRFVALKAKKCGFEYNAFGEGTMYAPMDGYCQMEETARQWLWIARELEMAPG